MPVVSTPVLKIQRYLCRNWWCWLEVLIVNLKTVISLKNSTGLWNFYYSPGNVPYISEYEQYLCTGVMQNISIINFVLHSMSSFVNIKHLNMYFRNAFGKWTLTLSQDAAETVWNHLAQLMEFALALIETLNRINSQSFNNFMLRIGMHSILLHLKYSSQVV